MTILRNSCLNIPLCLRSEEWFMQIPKSLARLETDFHDVTKRNVKKYYHINTFTNNLMIPRFYPLHLGLEITNDIPPGGNELDFICPKSTPRNDKQREAIQYMVENDDGILCLAPGEGKTVIAILALCKIKKKTIIYTHKDFLIEQWSERLLEHTNIKEDQIRRLRTKSFEEDLKYPIVLTTLQTTARLIDTVPDFQQRLYDANFGVAIWDECHVVGAETFSKSSLFTAAKKTFGLSATPKRSDGNTDILSQHLGRIYVPESKKSSTMVPKVIAVMFDHGVIKHDSKWIMQLTEYDLKQRKDIGAKRCEPLFSRDRYLKKLLSSDHSNYSKYMAPIIRQISKSDRHMVLLAERIKILDALSKYCVDRKEVGFFLPRSKEKRDSELKDKRLVFSTYQSCRDGVDKAEIDCLVMATPCGNWEQAIGRSIRPKDDKQQPVVIDVIDSGFPDFLDWGRHRIEQYEKKNWPVEVRVLDQ